MDEDELRRIEVRAEAAALGPWILWIEGRDDHTAGSGFIQTRGDDIELFGASRADQDFIAAARSNVPALIAEVRRLKQLIGST